MRTIKKIHKAISRPIADLKTVSPIPSATLEQIDPFIFLNHHGPQVYPENNNGLPFGPHPHRGMETVTFIVEGDIAHKDTGGHESVINEGGVQWMTAGSGLIHAEVSSDEFLKQGGDLEILQLWVNLPAKYKMTAPAYIGLQKDKIPAIKSEDGKTTINLVAGTIDGQKGAFDTLTDIFLSTISLEAGAQYDLKAPADRNVFFYVIRGNVNVNNTSVSYFNLVEFDNTGEDIRIKADEDSLILFGHATPFNEPLVARGPFVMNSEEEIEQAYNDFYAGKLGTWS
ncbi:pirin family protein [Fulvivirga sediminis]|uniref:Pirin family protein n=1 Tax=Fulvivirga sediminis TaxID=2803949 RepID=A0A937K0V4_9BACT|nr:pirin family protein [Fulvivirga sediminis]MBL3655992.1 pirin family protein [Fulvivirga sediminis]